MYLAEIIFPVKGKIKSDEKVGFKETKFLNLIHMVDFCERLGLTGIHTYSGKKSSIEIWEHGEGGRLLVILKEDCSYKIFNSYNQYEENMFEVELIKNEINKIKSGSASWG